MTPDTSELGFAFPPWLLWSAPVFMSERNQISRVWFKSAVFFFSFRGVSEAGFKITVQLFLIKIDSPTYMCDGGTSLSAVARLQRFTSSLRCLLVRAPLRVPGHSGTEAELRKGKAGEMDTTSPAGP